MSDIEIEVKFLIKDTVEIKKRIRDAGAELLCSEFETNIRFDTAEEELLRKRSLLRLRKASKTTLTFKSDPGGGQDEYKVHNEYEAELQDFDAMKKILEALGYRQAQVYEKRRETYSLGGADVCIDTMPYGVFVEIEGEGREIRSAAGRLGLEWEKRILANYLEMFEYLRSACGLDFRNVTFSNFRAVDEADLEPVIRRFEQGCREKP